MLGEIDPDGSEGYLPLRAYFYNVSGGFVSYQDIAYLYGSTLNTTWVKVGNSIVVPTNAVKVRLRFSVELGSGWVAYDDVSITKTRVTKYYYAGSQRVAVRRGLVGGTGGLTWLLSDHPSTSSGQAWARRVSR